MSVKEMISVLKPKNFGQFCKVLGLSYGTNAIENFNRCVMELGTDTRPAYDIFWRSDQSL